LGSYRWQKHCRGLYQTSPHDYEYAMDTLRHQKLMGHRSITTTERCAHVSRDNFAGAIALLKEFVTNSVTRQAEPASIIKLPRV